MKVLASIDSREDKTVVSWSSVDGDAPSSSPATSVKKREQTFAIKYSKKANKFLIKKLKASDFASVDVLNSTFFFVSCQRRQQQSRTVCGAVFN